MNILQRAVARVFRIPVQGSADFWFRAVGAHHHVFILPPEGRLPLRVYVNGVRVPLVHSIEQH